MNQRENLITWRTMAVYPAYHERYQSVILNQTGKHVFSERSIMELMNEACMRNGASYDGRVKAVKHVLPYFRKTPVMISKEPYILAFPTVSPRNYECTWLFCTHIENFSHSNGKTYVHFKNGSMLEVSCSVRVLRTQLERAFATLNYFVSVHEDSNIGEKRRETEPSIYSSLMPSQSPQSSHYQL
ncbi:competence protein ComK [Rossellomorea aquimaris]|uniref:competence protein ComK n=1 Tax=Rossellomorea aquimaris TaxID=189382 RepID=UPI001CD7845A|nr:competence protein ComK [Rossellomorea aquimaris]MCA1055239.1 competence protein ComK [Rossellomorea aquimaris]